MDANPVRVQWDPERDAHFASLPHRSIQVGLTRDAIQRYASDWIVSFEEITGVAQQAHAHLQAGEMQELGRLLPEEAPYPLSPELATRIGTKA